jgi:hypothetical protein
MDNQHRIQCLTQEIREAQESFREKQRQAMAARNAAWKTIRRNLYEIYELGGHEAAGYSTFRDFCKGELGGKQQAMYAGELTYAYFETMVFKIELCTYVRNWFQDSGTTVFHIRASCGTGKWRFNEEEIDRAKKAWDIALKLAQKSDRALPDKNDMGEAVATVTGKGYEAKLTPLSAALRQVEELQTELNTLRELKHPPHFASIKELRDRQKAMARRINLVCQSGIQQERAMNLLVMEGVASAEKYLQVLLNNRNCG